MDNTSTLEEQILVFKEGWQKLRKFSRFIRILLVIQVIYIQKTNYSFK